MDKIKPLFTATAVSTGGRNGKSATTDGMVSVDLSIPKEMGGPGKPNTVTPEHLFAVGYAACFGSSIDHVAGMRKKDASKAKVSCSVTIGKKDSGGFGLAVKMQVEDKSMPKAELEEIVKEAHEKVCPYSAAIRGNVEVTLEVIGS